MSRYFKPLCVELELLLQGIKSLVVKVQPCIPLDFSVIALTSALGERPLVENSYDIIKDVFIAVYFFASEPLILVNTVP